MNQLPPNSKNSVTNSDLQVCRDLHIGDKITNHNYFAEQKGKAEHDLTDIPTDATHIIGRDDEINKIKAHFEKNKRAVLIHGIGGMGKTTVARKYMVEEGGHYTYRAWLNAAVGLREAFINNYTLLKSLDLREDVTALVNSKQLKEAFELIIKKIKDLGSVLVVLDNANSLEDLLENKKHFEGADCHFVITTRAEPIGWALVPITELPEPDALAMFKHIHPTSGATDAELAILLNQLFRHPLLIELVAKTAKASNTAFPKLRAAIEEKWIHDPEINKRKVDVSGHSDSTTEDRKRATVEEYIWLIFQNVQDLGDHAKGLLRAFSLLPTATAFDEDFLVEHFAFFGMIDNVYDTLDIQLVEGGWLTKETLDDKPAYRMHPLIAEVVVKHLGVDVSFADAYIKQVATIIHQEFFLPSTDSLKLLKHQVLGERLFNLFIVENSDNLDLMICELSYLESYLGSNVKAAEQMEHVCKTSGAIYKEIDSIFSERLEHLAQIYLNLGHFDSSAELLEIVMSCDMKIFGNDSRTIAIRQSVFAEKFSLFGRYDRAVELLEASLLFGLNNFGNDSFMVKGAQMNLVKAYRKLDLYDKKAKNLEASLPFHLNLEQEQKRNTIDLFSAVEAIYSSLTYAYRSLGRYDRAAELLEITLKRYLKTFDNAHPHLAVCQSNLALVYENLGRKGHAAELLETALASDLKNFGKDHPKVAIRQSILANVYGNLGRCDRAAELLETALASDLKNFGPDHPTVAVSQNNLANIFYQSGQRDKARVLWQAAYKIYLKNLGPDHPHTKQFKEHSEM